MTELQWYYEGTTSRIIGLADDFFRRQGAVFRKRKDIPAYEVNQRRQEGSDELGVNEAALISFKAEGGARQAYMRAIAQGSGCQVMIEEIKDGWDFVKPYWLEFVKELQNQNELIVPTIAYPDVDEQLQSELEQGKDSREQTKVNFVVNTTPVYFHSWLNETTSSEMWRKGIRFPTERGEFQLGATIITPKSDVHSSLIHIAMHGNELTETDEGRLIMRGGRNGIECIRFTLLPISEKRTEVTAECRVPLVMPYYKQLLEQIAQVYPETAEISSTIGKKTNNAELRSYLIDHFNSSELNDLCFDLGINFESLSGDTIDDKVRELILYCSRRGLEADLRKRSKALRPKIQK